MENIPATNGHRANGHRSNGHRPNGIRGAFNIYPDPAVDAADARVQCEISAYRSKMVNANRNFLIERVDQIKAMNLSTESENLNLMARFIFHKMDWPSCDADPSQYNSQDRELLEKVAQVTTVEELKWLQHPKIYGTMPPSFRSDVAVEVVVKAMEDIAKARANEDDNNSNDATQSLAGVDTTVPAEIHHFLKYLNGVKDPDFRYSGICQWSPVSRIQATQLNDSDTIRTRAESTFQRMLVTPHRLHKRILDDWEVKVGFRTGKAYRYDELFWTSYYLFCRSQDRDDWGYNHGWAWRIVFCCHSEEVQYQNEAASVFDEIRDMLEWYGSWVGTTQTDGNVQDVFDWSDDE